MKIIGTKTQHNEHVCFIRHWYLTYVETEELPPYPITIYGEFESIQEVEDYLRENLKVEHPNGMKFTTIDAGEIQDCVAQETLERLSNGPLGDVLADIKDSYES